MTYLITKVTMQHADDRCTFVVGYVIKDFIHLRGMAHRYFNRMRIFEPIKLQSPDVCVGHKLGPDVILRE